MADVPIHHYPHRPQAQQQQPQSHHDLTESIKGMLPEHGPSGPQVAAVAALVPVAGVLLTVSGLTLAATAAALAVAAPVFVIFSPVLVPAAIAVGLGVTGFLASGAFGLTGLSSLWWIVNHVRTMSGSVPEQMEHAKRRVQEAAGHVGQRTKDVGQGIQERAA